MKNNIIKTLITIFVFLGFAKNINADELKSYNGHQFNFFSGIFDMTNEAKNSELFGVQHSSDNLFRETFLGKISPITGFMITDNSDTYFYTGVQAEYKIGKLNLTPSFSPGIYTVGDGKDLGSPLEFKSEVQLSYSTSEKSSFGVSYNHVSNASLGDKNPGANSYMFNFLKNF